MRRQAHPIIASRFRAFAQVRFALLVLVALASACGRDQRPDVLLIVLDTVRADHLSVYGYPRPTTPVLEALAAESARYDLAIAPGTWTVSSHASLFTGLMPSSHGAYRTAEGLSGVHGLDASIETLAERLRTAGYRTAAFVGNDAYLDPALGMNRGASRRGDHAALRVAVRRRAALRRRSPRRDSSRPTGSSAAGMTPSSSSRRITASCSTSTAPSGTVGRPSTGWCACRC